MGKIHSCRFSFGDIVKVAPGVFGRHSRLGKVCGIDSDGTVLVKPTERRRVTARWWHWDNAEIEIERHHLQDELLTPLLCRVSHFGMWLHRKVCLSFSSRPYSLASFPEKSDGGPYKVQLLSISKNFQRDCRWVDITQVYVPARNVTVKLGDSVSIERVNGEWTDGIVVGIEGMGYISVQSPLGAIEWCSVGDLISKDSLGAAPVASLLSADERVFIKEESVLL